MWYSDERDLASGGAFLNDCEYLPDCPIFDRFKSEGARNFWIAMYCQGSRREHCARRQLRKAGREAPVTLLPNGTHLDALG
jgi:hypothetical protein